MIPLLIARNTFREVTRDRVVAGVVVAGLALLTWVLVLLARTVLEHRLWRFVLLCSLGMLALGVER